MRRQTVRTLLAAMLAAALALPGIAPLAAQEPTAAEIDALAAREAERRREYERLSRTIELSQERRETLAAEIDAMRKDNAALTAAMIQAAKTERKLSEDIDAIGRRMTGLKDQEEAIRLSLKARRGVLIEVLAALQRMGLDPPPAILVRPEDALASVRSAILLGAVVPELRAETEILLADLRELARVVASIEAERDRLKARIADQQAEKQRLTLLLEERRKLQATREAALAEERARAELLAAQATNLQELIGTLESEIASLREAEEARRRREAELASRPVPEDNRLPAAVPFSARRGQMALPVAGRFGPRFGAESPDGGTVMGDIVRTQSGAIVTAPADGTVLYAGPFRSYGQLLILNAGDGYHVVLAGMDRITVSLGQSVLAGEPVGAMGETRLASIASFGDGQAEPELYVEFRKDGKPVDPSPWWAERLSGRTGNDT